MLTELSVLGGRAATANSVAGLARVSGALAPGPRDLDVVCFVERGGDFGDELWILPGLDSAMPSDQFSAKLPGTVAGSS